MIPAGAAPLIEYRKERRPFKQPVFVSFGNFRRPDWDRWDDSRGEPEIVIYPTDPIERLDLRALAGLHCLLFLADYGDKAARLYERLQDVAREIDVLSPAFDLDIGWRWSAAAGQKPFFGEATA